MLTMGICLKSVLNHPNDFHPIMSKMKLEKKILKEPFKGFRYSMIHKGNLKAIIQHPDELYPLLKMNIEMKRIKKQNHEDPPHWKFCNYILTKVSNTLVLVTNQLDDKELRDAVCILYLVLRALDTVEDDSSITNEIKVPVLKAFHRHIYDRDFRFTCGTKEKKLLMDNFHHVSTAFLELNKSYQEVIENTAMKMGAGMAKFTSKEVETIDDYDEYCYIVASLFTLGFTKLFHLSGKEISFPDSLPTSVGLFFQKVDIIKDYMEDISETPKPHIFWPREIWRKYANNLEDLTYEENSENAIQCVNEMVTNALVYIDDCLQFLSQLRDPSIFRFFAILQVIAMGDLALCYNNIQVFRTRMSMRRGTASESHTYTNVIGMGLKAKVFVRTKTMADVYGAFYDFSSILRSKVDMNDPNAKTTISRIEAVQKLCRDSGTLIKWKSYIIESRPSYNRALIQIALLITTVAVLYACGSLNRLNKIGSTSSQTKLPTHISSTENVTNE